MNATMSSEKSHLNDIAIVLNRPIHPENIGSTARAMKNMGITHLLVVDPRKYKTVYGLRRMRRQT
jgi:tRNA C32,U32 (ribose-2'-O)-methylase TrmJ